MRTYHLHSKLVMSWRVGKKSSLVLCSLWSTCLTAPRYCSFPQQQHHALLTWNYQPDLRLGTAAPSAIDWYFIDRQ